MFNKPALFPKVADPQVARGPRVGPGSLTSGSASSLSRSASESAVSESEAPTATVDERSATVSAAPATGAVGEDPARETGSCLIVGPDVKLKGAEILDCDTLVVEGRVEATMDSRVIRIAEKGSFSGTVGIDVAEVHGRFEGELTARSQLIIHATGRVSGKIRYGKILIEEGGEISGDVQSLATAKETARDPVRSVGRDDSPVKVAIGA
ncbi:bactofilin family protein [Aromatoleum diolicum]|uniref:Polymer-forming cytoskeletal protein n=1 Tax=Aromatoleum diolicum TaxID=75796 RepID=A0ABX1QHL8_9RHOO|nr:polymer-forming cytoskeletal protein [Aromatoleum diolicum]NMG76526.1 polymer-forming cytoskeletal protein [Aromatoleum diolicum]